MPAKRKSEPEGTTEPVEPRRSTRERKPASGTPSAPAAPVATKKPPSSKKTQAAKPASKKEEAKEDVVEGTNGTVEEGKADEEPAKKKAKTETIEVGDVIPEVTLKNEDDQDVNTKDLLAEKGAVFFVYPKASTPGCTTQACSFRDSFEEFGKLDFQVFGLSMDSPKAQTSWKSKQNLQFSFLCDPKQSLIKALGASKTASSVARSHFVVGKGGKLLDTKIGVKPVDSSKQALEFIKSLGSASS